MIQCNHSTYAEFVSDARRLLGHHHDIVYLFAAPNFYSAAFNDKSPLVLKFGSASGKPAEFDDDFPNAVEVDSLDIQ